MPFSSSHRVYISARGEKYGRYSHIAVCSCGAQLGKYGTRQSAERAARRHKKAGK